MLYTGKNSACAGTPTPRLLCALFATDTRQSVNVPADVRYSFKNLPFGFYRLLVTHQGFTPSSELIEIRSEAPQNHEATLGIQPIETAVNVVESDTLIDPNRSGTA